MPQIGPMEIVVVAVIALLVFGPQKLPELARSVGKAASELRRMANDVKSEFESGFDTTEEEDEATRLAREDPERATAGVVGDDSEAKTARDASGSKTDRSE